MNLLQQMAAEPYEARGILHSEAALMVLLCQTFGITRIVESGRARGQSTYMLAKYLPHVQVHSIDLRPEHPDEEFARQRLRPLRNVALMDGDGREQLKPIAAALAWSGHTVALFCDGPKGHDAIDIVSECFAIPQVRLGFIHDMRRLDHGKPSPFRAAAQARFPKHRFTDDPRYVAATSWMDANVARASGPCGPEHEKTFGSYGPTLGAFFNSSTSTAIN